MDSKTSTQKPTTAKPGMLESKNLQATSRRVFARNNDEAPAPEYVNNVEFSGLGMDVFMDMGTVTPESIAEALKQSGNKPPSVKFHVDFRFGMSLQTAAMMHQRLTAILQASGAQAAEMEKTVKTQVEKDEPLKGV